MSGSVKNKPRSFEDWQTDLSQSLKDTQIDLCRSFEDLQIDLEGVAHVGEGRSRLADLPEACIASILSFTSPRDVARLACASRALRAASSSDEVWQMMLPPHYTDILAQDPNAPSSTCSSKAVYDYLRRGVFLQNNTQKFWLDQSTGGVCRSIGARGLFIVWGEDERYWNWPTLEGSRFPEVAYLKQVIWFEVEGRLRSYFPPGTYILSWRILMATGLTRSRSSIRHELGNTYGWSYNPMTFSLDATDNDVVDREFYLTEEGRVLNDALEEEQQPVQQPLEFRFAWDTWMDVDVGEFTVEKGDSPVDLTFSLTEIRRLNWKSGMYLDGVLIRPSFVDMKDQSKENQGTGKASTSNGTPNEGERDVDELGENVDELGGNVDGWANPRAVQARRSGMRRR